MQASSASSSSSEAQQTKNSSNDQQSESAATLQKPSLVRRLFSWLYSQAANTTPGSMLFWISVAAASWFFSNFINKKRFTNKLLFMQDQYNKSLSLYKQEFRRKEDHLQRTLVRLQEEVDISKQAIQHNAMLRQKQTLLNEQLVQQREQQRQLQFKASQVEEQLMNCRERVVALEAEINTKALVIEQLNSEKQTLQQTIEQNLQQIKQKDKMIAVLLEEKRAQEVLLQRAKETQEVMEYVLGRFAPELAKKLQEILSAKQQQTQLVAIEQSKAEDKIAPTNETTIVAQE